MNIKKINELLSDVKPYDKGTAVMWTDEYISKQLLDVHINPDIDVASRKKDSIDKTIEWIINEMDRDSGKILDLGCGPGLYTQRLAKKGYDVTGIDFSKNSIEYANEQNNKNDLDIKYFCMNYLELDFKEEFDLIMMIYCDFGVLSEEERGILLKNVYRALKPGGIFIFDALNHHTINNMSFNKSWEFSDSGFWQDTPYLSLSQSIHFPEKKAILDQTVVINETDNYKIYRFWNHYFDGDDIKNLFVNYGFNNVKVCENLLEDGGLYNDKGVCFYKVIK